jgi:hypothetical protein
MKRIKLEHENKISKTTVPITGSKDGDRSSIWYMLLLVLAPLYFLIIIGAIVLALIWLDRHFISVTNFILQQNIFIGIMIVGMIVAIIVYSLSVNHALKVISIWRQNSHIKQANAGLLVLALVATILVLPIILALFFH